MKGVTKWFIGFLTLLGLFVPSLLTSSDASALKYALNSVGLYQRCITKSNGSYCTPNPSFAIWYDGSVSNFSDSYVVHSDNGSLSGSWKFNYNSLTSCGVNYTGTDSVSNIFWRHYVESRNYTSFESGNSTSFVRRFPDCSSLPLTAQWSYDSFYTSDYNLVSGNTIKLVDVHNLIFDDFENENRSLKRFDVSYYLDSSISHTANTPFTFEFGLVQESGNNFPYLDLTNLNISGQIQYFDSSENSYTQSFSNSSCSIDDFYRFNVETDDFDTRGVYVGFNISCSYTPTTDMHDISVSWSLYKGVDYNPSVWLTYNYSGIYFSGSYIVTDNDNSWSGELGTEQPSGDGLTENPSYLQIYGYPSSDGCVAGDFLCELSNLFSFNFFNPFYPLFGLFTDANSCAEIPIIADMLHSEETTYCPWFPSSVRLVLTPVLGLASFMLIFGFLVRWLGSSSGNMFEDSANETLVSPNNSGSWGRRRK